MLRTLESPILSQGNCSQSLPQAWNNAQTQALTTLPIITLNFWSSCFPLSVCCNYRCVPQHLFCTTGRTGPRASCMLGYHYTTCTVAAVWQPLSWSPPLAWTFAQSCVSQQLLDLPPKACFSFICKRSCLEQQRKRQAAIVSMKSRMLTSCHFAAGIQQHFDRWRLLTKF